MAAWCVARDLGAMAKRLSGKYRETQATDSRERYRWPAGDGEVWGGCHGVGSPKPTLRWRVQGWPLLSGARGEDAGPFLGVSGGT